MPHPKHKIACIHPAAPTAPLFINTESHAVYTAWSWELKVYKYLEHGLLLLNQDNLVKEAWKHISLGTQKISENISKEVRNYFDFEDYVLANVNEVIDQETHLSLWFWWESLANYLRRTLLPGEECFSPNRFCFQGERKWVSQNPKSKFGDKYMDLETGQFLKVPRSFHKNKSIFFYA